MSFPTKFLLGLAAVAVLLAAAPHARANAPAGRYTTAGGTVTDNKTGLTWQQPAPTTTYTWANAMTYCPTLGAGWRLPTIKELQTLVDYSQTAAPLIDTNFAGTQSYYWSSTSAAASEAWVVYFNIGLTSNLTTMATGNVRCVR